MNTNLSLEFIIAIVTLIAGIIAIMRVLINFKSDLQKDIHKLEIDLGNRITKLEIEIVKLQNKFDGIETKQIDLEKQVAEVKTETSTRVNQIETENKNYIKEIMNKVLEVFPKSAL